MASQSPVPPPPPQPAAPPQRLTSSAGSGAGVYLLPSLFTLGNLFCGYACVIYAMRGEYEKAAPFIGIAIVLDMLDGRIARMTGSTSEFGLQFDSLADVISFGMAPAILSFQWGLASLGRLGWAAAFLFVTAAALRLARFNIQAPTSVTSATSSACPAPQPPEFLPPPCSPIRPGSTIRRRPCPRSRWSSCRPC